MLQLEQEFKEFLNDNFQFVENKFGDRVHIYTSSSLVLRIVQDVNGFRSIEISTIRRPDNWFDLSVIRSYILNNEDYFKALDFKIAYAFLISYYQKVKALFDEEKYAATEKAISELRHLRAERNYGYKRPK